MPGTLPDRVSLATIPNVIPSERVRGADFAGFVEAVHIKMVAPVERLLDRLSLERKPDAIVADTFLAWGVGVGSARGIPVCSLWTQPATFFLALWHLDRWPPVDGHQEEEGLSCKSLDQYLPFPALAPVKCSDMKTLRSMVLPMKRLAQVFSNLRKAQCVLFTSFYELETGAIDGTSQVVPCPIYAVGPSIPYMPLEGDSGEFHFHHEEDYFDWLDAQPRSSVLYVSFGTHVSMPSSQLEEVALGLHESTVRFFWVARDRASTATLEQISAGGKGLVVPWCDQLKVLCHPSVGGFLSHCGWNSTLEAVFAGVPMLALPVAWDQLVIGHLVADEWKIGVDLRERRREDGVVGRAAICDTVTKLMDLTDDDSLEMRRRAAELREASRRAVQEGGSSRCSLNSFVRDVIEGRLNVAETSR